VLHVDFLQLPGGFIALWESDWKCKQRVCHACRRFTLVGIAHSSIVQQSQDPHRQVTRFNVERRVVYIVVDIIIVCEENPLNLGGLTGDLVHLSFIMIKWNDSSLFGALPISTSCSLHLTRKSKLHNQLVNDKFIR
jgi:hypothetical protein